MDRDPAGLDDLLWLLGLCTGLFGADRDGEVFDLLRLSGELDGLFDKEPVDARPCGLLLVGISTPSLFQYTGGVLERGGVTALGDARLPKEGEGVLARTGLVSSLCSLNSSVIDTLRRTTLEFASDSTGVVLPFATGVFQVGRGSLDPLLFWRAGERLVLCSVFDFEVSDLSNLGIALLVFLGRGSASETSLTSLLSVDTTDWLEVTDGSCGTYGTGDMAA